MEKFVLKNILPAKETDFSKGVFIILFNTTTVPPHLLLSVNGKIYSITDSGRQLGSPLEKLILFVKRKNVPTLFVEWKFATDFTDLNFVKLESEIKNCFLKYDKVVEGKVSCLFPIRDVAAKILGDEMNAANFIFELLPMMENKNALEKSYSLNMSAEISNGNFELLTYSEGDLRKNLEDTHHPDQLR